MGLLGRLKERAERKRAYELQAISELDQAALEPLLQSAKHRRESIWVMA